MAYIVGDPCVKCKYTDCVEVCPVDCFYTTDEGVVLHDKDLCIGCGICQAECPVQDRPAVYVTAVGESRSKDRKLLLRSRTPAKPV